MKAVLAGLLLMISITIFTIVIVKNVQLKQNCTGHLKRAADANSVETANKELTEAITYLEAYNMTKGYTSVLWRTPDEDIGFFYDNLKASQLELQKVTDSTSSLEKSNILMKLRETLMDNGEKGDKLTSPDGLARYPNNLMWGLLNILAGLILIILAIWRSVELDS